MATCRLRFMLEGGAGVCLWSQNDAARARFDYAVDTTALGLPPALEAKLIQLMADYDATINWGDPGQFGNSPDAAFTGPLQMGDAPDAFGARMRALLPELAAALGPSFEITLHGFD